MPIRHKLSYFRLHASAISLPMVSSEHCWCKELMVSRVMWEHPT